MIAKSNIDKMKQNQLHFKRDYADTQHVWGDSVSERFKKSNMNKIIKGGDRFIEITEKHFAKVTELLREARAL